MTTLLRAAEAAAYLGISTCTLKRWRNAGLIPGCAKAGQWRYDRAGLDQVLAARERTDAGITVDEKIRRIKSARLAP